MKEIFSISTGVNVAKAKPTSKAIGDVASDNDKTSSKDFLSVMFAQIKESIKISDEDSKLSLNLDSSLENAKVELDTKGEKKSVDSHLLENLLKVISIIKEPDAKISSFPSLSNKLTKLINSETALKELKGVNNITDLLKLSKKYDLGLEKISVKKLDLEFLKNEFPKLDKKFFEIPKESQIKGEKNILEVEKKVEIKVEIKPTILSINNIEKPKIKSEKEPTLFEKMMSSPKEEKKESLVQVAKDKVVELKKEPTIEVVKDKVVELKKEPTIEVVKDKVVELKREINTAKTIEKVKETVKIVQEEAPKVAVKEVQKEFKTKVLKEPLHVKIDDEIKKPETTQANELKVESNISKKGMIEEILQSMKNNKRTISTSATITQENQNLEIETKESSEIKTEPTTNRAELKPQIKTDTIASKQLTPTRDTFKDFAADFKEKMENYKPPVMKVQLALNPKGLGEVDVTIVNRGSNLHVNISSNTNTMSLFTQNQAEFKNSLVNMGFTNLEMNFSDQREKQEQQNNKGTKESNDFFEEENLEEETTSIELVVPQYV